jgi:hypothetical protein
MAVGSLRKTNTDEHLVSLVGLSVNLLNLPSMDSVKLHSLVYQAGPSKKQMALKRGN